MVQSMTGFGVGSAPVGAARVRVEVRAVNHRFLDVRVRFPAELGEHAPRAEEVARARLGRGRVEISARLEAGAEPGLGLDRAKIRALFRELAAIRDELAPDQQVPLSLLGAFSHLLGGRSSPEAEEVAEAITASTREACDALEVMRAREGAALAQDLCGRESTVAALVGAIEARSPAVVEAYRARLRQRLARLLEGADVPLDAGRLEQEVAILADRCDVAEELTRLRSHCQQLRRLVEEETEPVGRRLDFLLQEMHREANTVGSKSADAALSSEVIQLKAELERMREQIQNVL